MRSFWKLVESREICYCLFVIVSTKFCIIQNMKKKNPFNVELLFIFSHSVTQVRRKSDKLWHIFSFVEIEFSVKINRQSQHWIQCMHFPLNFKIIRLELHSACCGDAFFFFLFMLQYFFFCINSPWGSFKLNKKKYIYCRWQLANDGASEMHASMITAIKQ